MPEHLHKFAPLTADHPMVSEEHRTPCPACNKRFMVGDVVTLIALGPGDDEEAQDKARDGKPYNSVAIAVHWACATGERE